MNDNNKKSNFIISNDNENFHKEKHKNESESNFVFEKNKQKRNIYNDFEKNKCSNYSNFKNYLNRNITTNDSTLNKRSNISVDNNQNKHKKYVHDKIIKKNTRNKNLKNSFVNTNLYNYNNLIKNSKKINHNPYSEEQKNKKKKRKGNNNNNNNITTNNNINNNNNNKDINYNNNNNNININNNNKDSNCNNNNININNNNKDSNYNNNNNINNFNNANMNSEKYINSNYFNSYNKKDDYNNKGNRNNNIIRKNDTKNINKNKKNKKNNLENNINESCFNESNSIKDSEHFCNISKKMNNPKKKFFNSEDNNYNKSNQNNKNNEYTFSNNLTYKKKFNKITLSNNSNLDNSTSVKNNGFPHLMYVHNSKNNEEEMTETKNKNKEYEDYEIKNTHINKKVFNNYENKQNNMSNLHNYNFIMSNSNDNDNNSNNYNYAYINDKNYLNETNNYYCNNNKDIETLGNNNLNNNCNMNTNKKNLSNRNIKKVFYENNIKSSKVYNDDIEFNNSSSISSSNSNISNNVSNINYTSINNDSNNSNNFEMNSDKYVPRENNSYSFKDDTLYSENNNSNIVKMLSKYLNNLNEKGVSNLNIMCNELLENKNNEALKKIINTIKDSEDSFKINYPSNEYSKENRKENNLSKNYFNQNFNINNTQYVEDNNTYIVSNPKISIDKNEYSNNMKFIPCNKNYRNNLGERTISIDMHNKYKGENENNVISNTNKNSEYIGSTIINSSNNSFYNITDKDVSINKMSNIYKFKEKIHNDFEENIYEKDKKKNKTENKMKNEICNYSKKSEEIKEKWNNIILKCKSVNILNSFNKIDLIKDNIQIVDIFKISLFNNNNYYLYKNILYNNYKNISIHNRKFLFLENMFKFNKTIDKNRLTTDDSPISFDNFLFFFNNFYQITENYKNKICFFLLYKIIIMNEDDEEYGSFYNLILKILNKNTLILFLFFLINLMKNYSLKMTYFVNLIERLLPIITKNEKTTKKNKNKTFFNILYFKLFRVIFDKIECFHNHKKHLLLLFLRYIKNFLLNICSSILITQYIFIKCIDLMNKYNNQKYILIKTLSMEIFLQLWNNDSLKLYILKIGKPIIRFLIFVSNIEYINKNILSFILSPIENSNQLEIKKKLSIYFYNNKYYILERKKLKHYLKRFKENNKYSLYLSVNDSNTNMGEVHLESIGSYKENGNSNINIDINRTKLNNNTLLDYIFETKKGYNYFKILLTHEEKNCLNFLIKMNNQNNNFHFNLFYNLFIQNNLVNLIHENKLIYYIEYIKNNIIKKKRVNNFFKKNIKVRGLKNLKNDLIYGSNKKNNKRKNEFLTNDEFSKKMKSNETKNTSYENDIINCDKNLDNFDENNINNNDCTYLKEKIMYDMHEIIKISNCVLSKIYCSHIKLSFFFNIFFYKTYDIHKILSSSLSVYSRKFKNFKKENQKIIRFMNLNNMTHFLIIKFLLKSLKEIKSVNYNLFFLKEEKKKKKRETSLDFYSCYKFLEYALKKDINMVNIFLNYLNKIILHLYEKKRENIVLSVIITFTIYNFLTFIDKKSNVIEDLELLNLSDISDDIHKYCLIGLLLKENNFYIDNEIKYINTDDIYNYELKNHLKCIPRNINKEIFELVNFKKFIFQKGNYKKIEIIKILKKNIVNNLYTSEILNYIYYNSLYLLIHLIFNIRFYYNILHKTYKKNAYYFNNESCYILKNRNIFKTTKNINNYNNLVTIKKRSYFDKEDDDKFLIFLMFKKENYDNYLKKKIYIIKFYNKIKRSIIKNFKCYLLANNVNKYIKNLNHDKIFLDILFKFDNSSFFMYNFHLELYDKENYRNEFNKEIYEKVENESNNLQKTNSIKEKLKNGEDSEKKKHEKTENDIYEVLDNDNYNLNFLNKIKNLYYFVEEVNKVVYYMIHNEKNVYSNVECLIENSKSINKNSFSMKFHFYEIIDDNDTSKEDNENMEYKKTLNKKNNNDYFSEIIINNNKYDNVSYINKSNNYEFFNNQNSKEKYKDILCFFKYNNKKDSSIIYFNELLDYIICAIMKTSYKKEKILYWSEFFYNAKNFGLINFHIFFYLCSLIKCFGKKNNNYVIKRKIKICEKLYFLYLFKICFLLNISIYEAFDFLISIISILFNHQFFKFYLNKKIYSIEKEKQNIIQTFLSSVEQELENFILNYDLSLFMDSLKYISDSIFLKKSIKLLVFKSYCFINILLHTLPLKNILIDMNNITYLEFSKEKKNVDKYLEKYKLNYSDIKDDEEKKNLELAEINQENENTSVFNKCKVEETNLDNKLNLANQINENEINKENNERKIESSKINQQVHFNKINEKGINEKKFKIQKEIEVNDTSMKEMSDNDEYYDTSNYSEKFSASSTENEKMDDYLENFKIHEKNKKNLINEHVKKKEKKFWVFKILKFFYYRSFLCFTKNKSDEEHFYERRKNFIYFFFPKILKKEKENSIIISKLYKLIEKLIKDCNFLNICKQSFLLKWLCLRIFILHKYKYKTFNPTEIFQFIYKKLNSIENEEYFKFNIMSDTSLISFDNVDMKYTFNIFISYITKQVLVYIKKYYKSFIEENKKKNYQLNVLEEEKKREALFNQIYVYFVYFMISFYPYFMQSLFSYNVFLKLFKMYFNLYLINKISSTHSINSPIYLILLILVRHMHLSKYLTFSYFATLKNYLKTNDTSKIFCFDTLSYDNIVLHLRESVEYFMQNNKKEEFVYDDIKISYSTNSILLFYHMLISNFY
ncbi:conserved Plasmodium protein, unknown function [Plasmodium relictum]|uniref:Uncharacterized protein n=1 Tax=Plasmodium relictum TaxID=85471 RepID=A0A1J1H491_PLARL|nr:conserved Plasmodium protein, unknown function [Plasmodium relictum]CRG99727.1 conserved Plasmodium protein, unknown function [Plasmodium relictum]